MPSMQPTSSRLSCRSRNAFSPAAALWQHFVLPNRPIFHPLRQSSSTAEAAEPTEIDPTSPETPEVPVETPESPDKVHLNRGKKLTLAGSTKLMINTKRSFEATGNYDGLAVGPRVLPMGMSQYLKQWPWHRARIRQKYKLGLRQKEQADQVTGFEQLNLEIHEFHTYMRPTAQEALVRQSVIENVSRYIHFNAKYCKAEVFGSERTGLAFATSDIDLRLTYDRNDASTSAILPPDFKERRRLMGVLRTLAYHMKKHPNYDRVGIRHARYPLLSMQDAETGLDVQIVLANDTSFSRDLIAKYLEEFSYLSELYTVIKTFFDVRELSTVFRGGFGSYNIFMMIVASLKHSPLQQSDSAHALLNFMHFWATFDTKAHGISIEPVLLYDKRKTRVASEPTIRKLEESNTSLPDFILSLRDPADATNDLGRKGICIKHLQATCKHIYHQLVYSLDVDYGTMLQPVVGQIYSLNKEAREKLEARGNRIAKRRNEAEHLDRERLRHLAHSILAGKTSTDDYVAPTPADSLKKQEQPVVDTSDAIYEHGEAIVSAFSMPTDEDLAQDEAREAAEKGAAQVDMINEVVQGGARESEKETGEVNGQDEPQEQRQEFDSAKPAKTDALKSARDQDTS